jgi:hypothetical protein
MTPVAVPTHVGDLQWPVLSAIRVDSRDHPAELILLVDCGEGMPNEPYATLQLFIWPTRTKLQDGHYDLTWAEAQRSLLHRAGLLPRHRVEVVTVRHPQRANQHTIFVDGTHRDTGVAPDVQVVVVDVDLHGDAVEQDLVLSGAATDLRAVSPAVRIHVREVAASYLDDRDGDTP